MTYTLTQQLLDDLRFDLDLPEGSVFTDPELNRAYDRALGDYPMAKVVVLRALLMSAAKMNDYKAAQSSESLSQLYTHLKDRLTDLEAEAGLGGAAITLGNMGMNIDATYDNLLDGYRGDENVTY